MELFARKIKPLDNVFHNIVCKCSKEVVSGIEQGKLHPWKQRVKNLSYTTHPGFQP